MLLQPYVLNCNTVKCLPTVLITENVSLVPPHLTIFHRSAMLTDVLLSGRHLKSSPTWSPELLSHVIHWGEKKKQKNKKQNHTTGTFTQTNLLKARRVSRWSHMGAVKLMMFKSQQTCLFSVSTFNWSVFTSLDCDRFSTQQHISSENRLWCSQSLLTTRHNYRQEIGMWDDTLHISHVADIRRDIYHRHGKTLLPLNCLSPSTLK